MEKLKQQLTNHEGVELMPYLCTSGELTIGVGRNLARRGITAQEADFMLENDIALFTELVTNSIDTSQCNEPRLAVLINMAFNLGITGLLKFKNTLHAVEFGQYDLAAAEMLNSKWASQVGDRATQLSLQMETGLWQGVSTKECN
ncbi:glycoside hydrolase family protein [Pseudoalteromonas denitrificans]|uniref:Lysozyme n=1 Tax=Pseudoalteromonas denitrificans DSM 6059 TaxID=1123010 RepID=A0A1I1FYU2_9GAMM|nr:glycoside hydrolase family protein [Pseudoalteromonas denitrificans]SFC04534.1 lysozyme [Pseudoalteromonas denitrificans DSM 6059]